MDAPPFGCHAYNIVVDFYPPSPLIKTALNVRFGSLADISRCNRHVRFTPESGHKTAVRDLSNLMSALVPKMSALTPIADIHPLIEDVRFGPIADI
jgi:hypothetical protein